MTSPAVGSPAPTYRVCAPHLVFSLLFQCPLGSSQGVFDEGAGLHYTWGAAPAQSSPWHREPGFTLGEPRWPSDALVCPAFFRGSHSTLPNPSLQTSYHWDASSCSYQTRHNIGLVECLPDLVLLLLSPVGRGDLVHWVCTGLNFTYKLQLQLGRKGSLYTKSPHETFKCLSLISIIDFTGIL